MNLADEFSDSAKQPATRCVPTWEYVRWLEEKITYLQTVIKEQGDDDGGD